MCAVDIVLYPQSAQYEHMKHTSIRLTDEHARRIEATGEKPSIVVRLALDAYFSIPPDVSDPMRRLIEDHERRCHSAQNAHIASTENEAQRAQNVPKSAPNEHGLSTTALIHILAELEAGREPTINDVAHHFEISVQTLAKALSPLNVRAQETKRGGKAGRYFTRPMKAQIEGLLAGK